MRVIAYKKGFEKPIVDHVDSLGKIKGIVAGFIREDGYAVLQSSVVNRKSVLYVVPIGEMPQSLDEAITARAVEAEKNLDLAGFMDEAIDKDIVSLPNSVLWAMGLDPEIY